jgi:hypothetical protein
MGLELIDVLLLGEDDSEDGLLGIRVRRVLPGPYSDLISCQQYQDRYEKRCSPANSVFDRRQTPSRSV